MMEKLKGLVVEEQGQGMTEYGLVLGLIAVAAVGALALLRTEIIEMFTDVKDMVTNRETGGTAGGS
ncbi:Flp family type IVb pilin [Pseudalkalibacillus sp. Hm43]|uniref:Flp family type IVb pilin n=1 Tax=Pseudalkalibacillus sp. Hm43 TaxID=3450742 RepID=UPI003F41C4AF